MNVGGLRKKKSLTIARVSGGPQRDHGKCRDVLCPSPGVTGGRLGLSRQGVLSVQYVHDDLLQHIGL